MSESQVVYKVKINGSEYGADDEASASALAELLGGAVFTMTRKEALSHVRTITKVADYPPALSNMLALLKDTIIVETDKAGLLGESCWRVTLQYDGRNEHWYSEIKNLADGPIVYNQVTGEKYQSIVHARWQHGKSCAVKYLANGISGEDTFRKSKPASAK